LHRYLLVSAPGTTGPSPQAAPLPSQIGSFFYSRIVALLAAPKLGLVGWPQDRNEIEETLNSSICA
jgi:hypothetical protein